MLKIRQTNELKQKVIVQLSGGLGNQMFQYAAARSLAARNRVELVLDTWSGFVRDSQYKRSYELESFPLEARDAIPLERMPFWINRVGHKFRTDHSIAVNYHWYGVTLKETQMAFLPDVFEHQVRRSCWMTGYWQTARYFDCSQNIVKRELMPPPPAETRFQEIGRVMRDVNSVALGIRLYEESLNPGMHALNGQMKSIADINEVARQLAAHQSKLHFFVYCTHRSPALTQLRLPGKITYITPDDGFEGTLQTLWLLTQCRHHILTNSSYYWWGAWLSTTNYSEREGKVFAADNFINRDSILPQWKRF